MQTDLDSFVSGSWARLGTCSIIRCVGGDLTKQDRSAGKEAKVLLEPETLERTVDPVFLLDPLAPAVRSGPPYLLSLPERAEFERTPSGLKAVAVLRLRPGWTPGAGDFEPRAQLLTTPHPAFYSTS